MKLKNYKKITPSSLFLNPEYVGGFYGKNITFGGVFGDITLSHINSIRQLSKLEKIKSYSEYFPSMSKSLNIDNSDKLSWSLLVGRHFNDEYKLYLKESIQFSLGMLTSYHKNIYKKRCNLFAKIQTNVMLDKEKLDIPIYGHCSVTGRTNIKSGFNFLTLKKEKKKLLRSCKKNHILCEVDFKSCEPNFYLRAIGKEIVENDIYKHLAETLNINIDNREKFKRGILAIMYGAKDRTVKNILGIDYKKLEKIKNFFEITKFSDYLSKNFSNNKMIYNFYGRPICYDASLINYWIQSSAADYCCLAFLSLLDKNVHINPCFFVHDSMTFEIDKKHLNSIKKIKNIYEPDSNITMPVEITVIG